MINFSDGSGMGLNNGENIVSDVAGFFEVVCPIDSINCLEEYNIA